ncbi:aspartic proteinase CDR1 [Euphorbia lathyris]|uniref:aspartic proteinase CDR1 n=1 Tax=Euphorbia lathyris TaxID=212925 RepID=UPI0033139C43
MVTSLLSMAAECTLVSSFFLVFTTLMVANLIGASPVQPSRLVTRLIHRNSIYSPYYNPSETVADCIDRAMKSSATRLAHLYSQANREIDVNDFQLNLLPSSSEPLFLVNFSMGQPPVPQLNIMDTGSNLLWVRCAPCIGCSRHTSSLFDPSKSSTYGSLSCRNVVCHHAPGGKCNWLNQCVYNQSYVNGVASLGILATEQIIFQGSDEGNNIVSEVVFGCSYENGNYRDGRFTGVFGLGSGITSLVSQMGSKFSYCLGNIADPNYRYNWLVLGDKAKMEGYSTPLEVVNSHYYVTLEGISVGEKRLNIGCTGFRRRRSGDAVIIDSGTALTWLADNLYSALANEIRNLLDGILTPVWRGSFLCYKGRVSQDLTGFPVVTFHFRGGADLELESESLFYQATPDILCMAVRQVDNYGNDFIDFSVIGLMAQQYYNVAYDLSNYKLFFQRIDCELLAD